MKLQFISILILFSYTGFSQIDPVLLKADQIDTSGLTLNIEAIYDRPFLRMDRLPLAIGGYMEANYAYMKENGISDGHQFQMRRVTLFVASAISNRIKFLSEIEFEDGTKEINIEFASLDLEFAPLFNLRGGIVMNPIGAFNQNHDGPKWEIIDRPVAATSMLPATWSNAGFGLFGKSSAKNWVYAYELYLTNGFDDRIINNTENKTFLPATKENQDRFEESFNGSPLLTGKIAIRNRKAGELGLSYMSGIYNKYEQDGLELDKKRSVNVFAIDFNQSYPATNTSITSEWAWVKVDVPETYTEQFGSRQHGGFLDFVQAIYTKPVFGFHQSVINFACRIEFVDWNNGKFKSTGGNIAEDSISVIPGLSWRPNSHSVLRLNYGYNWHRDILGNPSTRAAIQFGISSYF